MSVSKESFGKKQFSNLISVKLALEGKSGSIIEKVDGKVKSLFFHTIFFKIKEF
jgi:hypothetical protein